MIDSRGVGNNTAKFNYRYEPNSMLKEVGVGVAGGTRNLVFLFPLEAIKAGSEVKIDYGEDRGELKLRPSVNRPVIVC